LNGIDWRSHCQSESPGISPARDYQRSQAYNVGPSLDVESWLQVDKYGLHLDKSQEALEALFVEIDLNEIVPVYMVRFGKNPPNYCRSYDGVTTFGSPKPWELTVREGQHLDADCRGQYSAVEIPMILTEAVELKRDRKTVEGGTRIGYTTSITGYRPFQKFWNECEKKGLTDAVVKVKLAYETRKSNGNEWGVVTYEQMLSDWRRHQGCRRPPPWQGFHERRAARPAGRTRVPATTNLKALNPQGARIHVLLGDLFDRPKVPFETIFFAAEAYREIVQTNPQVEFFILAGNHDLSRDSTHVSALQLFEKMVSVSVLTQPRRIGDDLLAIPWSP
jgi:hypothetical protein